MKTAGHAGGFLLWSRPPPAHREIMDILAISGSARHASTNTAMLRAVADIMRAEHRITVFSQIGDLPTFSPDLEREPLPRPVQNFTSLIRRSDAVIISSPEYVRSIPGGLKNAIDWLVSRDEIINKPIALMHASHRGDDMLSQIRVVLSTVSTRFREDLFLRFHLVKKSPDEILDYLKQPEPSQDVARFIRAFAACCDEGRVP